MLNRLVAFGAIAFALSSAQAAPIANSSGITGATGTIGFDEVTLAADTVVTNQYAAFGATFTTGVAQAQSGFLTGAFLGNFSLTTGATYSPFRINFTEVVNGAAFELVTNAGNTLFEALLDGSVVESFTAPTNMPSGAFYGFDGFEFDTIQITAPTNLALLIDNVQFRAEANEVPEPASLALLALGLGSVAAARRRKAF